MNINNNLNEKNYDIVVAGAGPAGMAAAIVAAKDGLKVLVVEKTDQVGGTAATSAGSLWIPGNTQSIKEGYSDKIEDASNYLKSLISSEENSSKRNLYLKMAPTVIDFFNDNTDVKFIPCGKHPDYRSDIPGHAVSGRAIIPEVFNGRLLGSNFSRLRPPIPEFMILGGMMFGKSDIPHLINRYKSLKSFWHTSRLVGRYFVDRMKYPRGTRVVMGNALVGRMYYSLIKLGVDVWFNSKIESVDSRNEIISKIIVSRGNKSEIININYALILATGGFSHNEAYRKKYMYSPTPKFSLGCEENKGDGLTIADGIGAEIEYTTQGGGGFWAPVSVTYHKKGKKGLFPHLSLDRAKPGLIAVNKKGVRFVNEGCSYHDFVEAMYLDADKNMPCYLVCDDNFINKYGLGYIPPGVKDINKYVESGYIKSAKSIKELAVTINVPEKSLINEINKNNEFAKSGKDLDYGKGNTELNKFNGDANHKPNPCIGSIDSPPYIAIEIWPAEIGCSAGIKTDRWGQVIGKNGKKISGLYTCGNDAASIFNGEYPGPGTTLGPALVFGYITSKHASGNLE
ncbi:FAD-dependent oxidoreductase [Halomonas sp. HAL1]|uniref:FAD-dependent oxidoreductase n=1 Tax=Halomonas sp. HAL1 TaxID=550984 RepID=UPI00022D303E|nr:FAD-dependent oxidoreductase [Halomonas sp. HAL1]EHA13643.1 FAD-binding dehydrogenase [Halomonas sp. HAL1]WKV91621.1 FAD-dependent oxidoreductase [Halomonas sp. HAL1]